MKPIRSYVADGPVEATAAPQNTRQQEVEVELGFTEFHGRHPAMHSTTCGLAFEIVVVVVVERLLEIPVLGKGRFRLETLDEFVPF